MTGCFFCYPTDEWQHLAKEWSTVCRLWGSTDAEPFLAWSFWQYISAFKLLVQESSRQSPAFKFPADEFKFAAHLSCNRRVFLRASDQIRDGVRYRTVWNIFGNIETVLCEHVREIIAHAIEL